MTTGIPFTSHAVAHSGKVLVAQRLPWLSSGALWLTERLTQSRRPRRALPIRAREARERRRATESAHGSGKARFLQGRLNRLPLLQPPAISRRWRALPRTSRPKTVSVQRARTTSTIIAWRKKLFLRSTGRKNQPSKTPPASVRPGSGGVRQLQAPISRAFA